MDRRAQRSPHAKSLDLGDLLVARVQDHSVVLHVPSGTYLKLDATATEILDLVKNKGSEAAVAVLADRHGLDTAVAMADVQSVLDRIGGAQASEGRSMRHPKVRGLAHVARQWAGLSGSAKLAVMKITALVVAVELALRRFPIDAIARHLGAPLADAEEITGACGEELDLTALSHQELNLLGAADWTLARWVFDATCLRRALLYGWVLRHRMPELRIGLMADDEVLAHAWLVVNGCTLGALDEVGGFSRMSHTSP
jgi:hypothetical protein